MKKLFLAGLIALLPLSAAQASDVATFLQRADAVQKKGMMALFSSDYKALKAEIVAATDALKNERLAAKAAGKRQAYCPPAKSDLNSSEILSSFRAIPPAQRSRTSVKDALRALLARKYPCRG